MGPVGPSTSGRRERHIARRIPAGHCGIGAIMTTLRSKYQGYWNHYGIRGNSASLQMFYQETRRILKKWLNRRSQRQSYTWEALDDLLKQFAIPLPHITEYTGARQMKFL